MLDFLAPYWNFLLVHPLISLLVLFYDFVHDFGFAIVLLTIAIRLALYPLFRIQIQNRVVGFVQMFGGRKPWIDFDAA